MHVPETTTETVLVPNISCNGCKQKIEQELGRLEGLQQVVVDLPARRVTFTWTAPASSSTIQEKMEELGYPLAKDLPAR